MTTNKQLLDVADEMAAALKLITDGLAKDGVALDGVAAAITVHQKWASIKAKRSMEKMVNHIINNNLKKVSPQR